MLLVLKMELNQALEKIWQIIREDDKFIEENKPWELVNQGNLGGRGNQNKFEKIMQKLVSDLYLASDLLAPFLPKTAEKIKKSLETKKTEMLFPRIK